MLRMFINTDQAALDREFRAEAPEHKRRQTLAQFRDYRETRIPRGTGVVAVHTGRHGLNEGCRWIKGE